MHPNEAPEPATLSASHDHINSACIVSGVKSRAGLGSLLQLFMQNKWNILCTDGMYSCLTMRSFWLHLELALLLLIEDERKSIVLGYM